MSKKKPKRTWKNIKLMRPIRKFLSSQAHDPLCVTAFLEKESWFSDGKPEKNPYYDSDFSISDGKNLVCLGRMLDGSKRSYKDAIRQMDILIECAEKFRDVLKKEAEE